MNAGQEKDSSISILLGWLKQGQCPSSDSIGKHGPEIHYYWARFDQLQYKDGLAYIQTSDEEGLINHLRLLVPRQRRREVMESSHNMPVGGHFGVQKTLEKVRSHFQWFHMKADIVNWCRSCAVCNSRKQSKKERVPMQPIESGFPFERIALDIVGPLPKTTRGNKYILVLRDYFTKWPEAFPLQNQEAVTIARILVSEVFARFGVPYILHSDQGTNFDSKLIKELCILLEIKKTRTTAYHPQCDGLVERFNRTLIDLIALSTRDAQNSWDLQIGVVLMAFRSSVQASTGFTPYSLMF